MLHIRKLVILSHWRKKYIFGLIGCCVLIYLCIPLINSLSLGQGAVVNTTFQHQITEIVGVLFLLYFGSTTLGQYKSDKIFQLLGAKKQEPTSMVVQIRGGLYTIYVSYVILTAIVGILLQGFDIQIVMMYANLLVSGAILLTIVMILSLLTNVYAAMICSLILYAISYSINFILFSTPLTFQESISYKLLSIIQYAFPRFDLLYSTLSSGSRIRAIVGNLLYLIVTIAILIKLFLSYYTKR